MTFFSVRAPFEMFTDLNGDPLENGYIYIGQANQNPITNPITVYWDSTGLYPAAQPIRTIGGFAYRNGQASNFYVNVNDEGDFSLLVKDKNGETIFFAASYFALIFGGSFRNIDIIDNLRAINGGIYPIYVRGYSAIADGGDGNFEWIEGAAPGTYVDDDCTIIVPTGGDGSAAWFRQYEGPINVKWSGAKGDGVTDDSIAIEAAWAIKKNIMFPTNDTYYAPGLTLSGSNYDQKQIIGNGATISGDEIWLRSLFGLSIENLKFAPTTGIYIEGLRYCKFKEVYFSGQCYWGKYDATGISSWSTYWNEFTECKWQGVEFTLSLTDTNFNSNTFTTCEFRSGSQSELFRFLENAAADGVFVSNTFIGCDMSYDPVFNIVDDYNSFSATIIGGYLDTGTDFYATGSYTSDEIEVIGIRNPSGVTLDKFPNACFNMTTGGARKRKRMPVGSLDLLKTETIPSNVSGSGTTTIISIAMPFDGQYSISAIFDQNGDAFTTTKFENITVGASADLYGILSSDGYSSHTFTASKGDEIHILLTRAAGTNTDILMMALTPGAGVLNAVPYRNVYPSEASTGSASNGITTDLVTISNGTYKNRFYRADIYTRNIVTGGGGEKIVLDIGQASGSTSVAVTITEITRTSVNGVGGTSDDSGTFTIAYTTSGTSFTINGTLSGTPATVNWKVELYHVNYA